MRYYFEGVKVPLAPDDPSRECTAVLLPKPRRNGVALWGAKSAREKFNPSDGTANFGLLRDPSFLGARMRNSIKVLVFE